MVDQEWDAILIGSGQNNFALGTYLGLAGLRRSSARVGSRMGEDLPARS